MQFTEEELARFSGTRILGLDIETTGVSKNTDHIIELGMVEWVDGKEVNAGSVVFGGGSSSPKALEVHGITDESRVGKPTFMQKAAQFKKVIEEQRLGENGEVMPTIIVGHNVKKFDIPFLYEGAKAAGYPILSKDGYVNVVDTLMLSRKHLSSPDHRLETLCKVFNVEHGGHRGLGDTYSSLKILCICMKHASIDHVTQIMERVRS